MVLLRCLFVIWRWPFGGLFNSLKVLISSGLPLFAFGHHHYWYCLHAVVASHYYLTTFDKVSIKSSCTVVITWILIRLEIRATIIHRQTVLCSQCSTKVVLTKSSHISHGWIKDRETRSHLVANKFVAVKGPSIRANGWFPVTTTPSTPLSRTGNWMHETVVAFCLLNFLVFNTFHSGVH